MKTVCDWSKGIFCLLLNQSEIVYKETIVSCASLRPTFSKPFNNWLCKWTLHDEPIRDHVRRTVAVRKLPGKLKHLKICDSSADRKVEYWNN